MVTIVAEKYDIAKQIADIFANGIRRTVNKSDGRFGYWRFDFKGENAVLLYVKGHILQLAEPKTYGVEYAQWEESAFPLLPNPHNRIVPEEYKAAFDDIAHFMKSADWLISATDNDREGDSIFREMYDYLGLKTSYKKAIFDDPTPEAFIEAFANLQDGEERRNLEKAGEARGYIDYDIGNNMTVLATKCMPLFIDGNRAKILQGRVKTATLSMIVKREKEIGNFKKSNYYRVQIDFGFAAELNKDFIVKEDALEILENCKGKPCVVKSFEKKIEIEKAPKLYNTTAIEAAANRKFGFMPKQTSAILEKMYIPKGVSTYPRTGSVWVAENRKESIAEIIKMLMATNYKDYYLDESKWTPFDKKHFNTEKVHGHPAITPTLMNPTTVELDEAEKKVYDLLCRSLLALVFPTAKYEKRTVVIGVGEYEFVATSRTLIEKGWKVLYDDTSKGEDELPLFNIGDKIEPKTMSLRTLNVTPPRPYTLASLLEAMEVAGQDATNEEIADMMRSEERALGTGATRNKIIDDLFNEGYIMLNGNSVHPTKIGTWITDNFPIDELKDVMFTAEMEHKLFQIQQGKLDYKAYCNEIQEYVRKWSEILKNSCIIPLKLSSTGDLKCPNCNGLIVTRGKREKYWMCERFKSPKSNDYTENACTFCVPIKYKDVELTLKDLERLSLKKATAFHTFKYYAKDDVRKENQIIKKAYLFWDSKSRCIKESNVVPKCRCPICQGELQVTAKGYRCINHIAIEETNKKDNYKCPFYVPAKFLDATISISDFKNIANGKSTNVKTFTKNDGKQFCASLFWDGADKKIGFKYVIEGTECPACRGKIKVTNNAWFCENYEVKLVDENKQPIYTDKGKQKRKCIFYLPKDYEGNTLNESDLKAICSLKATRKLDFISKKGNSYQSPLRYDKAKGYIVKDYEAGKIKCPICKAGDMIYKEKQDKRFWLCSNRCGFITSANINGVEINETVMKQLSEKDVSSPHTFKKKDGSGEYKARFKIDHPQKKIQLVYVKTRKAKG